tara:strand:+ start:20036 stop:21583 length:1548 start_codon:yes stop_codon:yes gene_type:complete
VPILPQALYTSPLYTSDSVKQIDNLAIHKYNTPGYDLMCLAGQAVLQFVLKKWPDVKTIAIVCGSGNNGGDGYVIARLLKKQGISVKVYAIANKQPSTKTAQQARNDFEASAGIVSDINTFHTGIETVDLIVDAMLGTGIQAPLHESVLSVITKINQINIPVCAVDIPTGIDGNTGAVLGSAVKADATVSFIGLKIGLLIGAALDYVGELALDTLNVPAKAYQEVKSIAQLISYPDVLQILPQIQYTQHKGQNGRVMIMGGGLAHHCGAVCLSGEAALRAGAGLVSTCVAPESIALMARGTAELMCYAPEDPNSLSSVITQADALVVGPGLGQTAWSRQCLEMALKREIPMVVDADALNLLAKAPEKRKNWILTPHPGEAARLLNQSIAHCESNRVQTVQALQNKYGGTIVLKGASTIILDAEGVMFVVEGKVPALATGGTGDILAGLIGGLLGQGLTTSHAAQLGVSVHREAGWLEQTFGPRGMLASDLLLHIRSLLNPSNQEPSYTQTGGVAK